MELRVDGRGVCFVNIPWSGVGVRGRCVSQGWLCWAQVKYLNGCLVARRVVLCKVIGTAAFPEVPRNRGLTPEVPLACPCRNTNCDFRFGSSATSSQMFSKPQRQAPWTPIVAASTALGLALYYLHSRTAPTTPAPGPTQVSEEQPCQASVAEHQSDAMNPEERAYHERFMREAIAMVNYFQ